MELIISKSKYLAGLQCPKLLWYLLRAPKEVPPLDESTRDRLEQGSLIGEFAKQIYPQGVDIGLDEGFDASLEQTKKLVAQKKTVFEASFLFKDLFCRADIIVPNNDSWDLIEVKSSSRVKDVHIQDLSFQKYVLEKCGLKINRCFVQHINTSYVRVGEINPEELFTIKEVTARVDEECVFVQENLDRMRAVLAQEIPSTPIGTHCNKPHPCIMKPVCWNFLPKNNVTQLHYNSGFDWLKQGVSRLVDVPSHTLTPKQRVQQQAIANNELVVDKKHLKRWLESLEYPLYFFDFETSSAAIPFFNHSRPFQQIPFQYSLHIIDEPGSTPRHRDFLWEENSDPREALVKSLSCIKNKGSVLVYSMSFERKVLRELAQNFPEFANQLHSIDARLVDLIVPFRNFWAYHPQQEGKTSIKKVLPALCNKDYSQLTIQQGDVAAREWLRAVQKANNSQEIFNSLKEYCKLDTRAMVDILSVLEEVTHE